MSYRSINDINKINELRQQANLPSGSTITQMGKDTLNKGKEEVANSLETIGNELISQSLTKTLGSIDKTLKNLTGGSATHTALSMAKKAIKAKNVPKAPAPTGEQQNEAFDPSSADEPTAPVTRPDPDLPKGTPSEQPADEPIEPTEPTPTEPTPSATESGGDGLGDDVVKAGEKDLVNEGEKDVEGGVEDTLEGLTGESASMDETPIGLAITGALGIATLVAGIFTHKHKESTPTPVIQPQQQYTPTNYSSQMGI